MRQRQQHQSTTLPQSPKKLHIINLRTFVLLISITFPVFLFTMGKKLNKAPNKAPNPSSSSPPFSSSSSIPHPSTFTDGAALPKMIVFDLDYTLWPFWVDTHVTPPLKASSDHTSAKDRFGESFAFYNEVPSVLSSLRHHSIKVGAASRTSAPDLGREMLKLLHIPDTTEGKEGKKRKAIEYFDYMEIYPGSKITHFTKLQKSTGLKFEEMLFFDDEARNRNVESLGVTMYLVRDGVSRAEVDNGVREWRKRHGHALTARQNNEGEARGFGSAES